MKSFRDSLLVSMSIATFLLGFVLFPRYSQPEPHFGKGLYVFHGPSEDLWFNRIELNLTRSVPRMTVLESLASYEQSAKASVRTDFNLLTRSLPDHVGLVSPWPIERILGPRTSYLNKWTFRNFRDFSIAYFKPQPDMNEIVTLEFELSCSAVSRFSYYEFLVAIPFPPISQRVNVEDVEAQLRSMSADLMLFPMTQKLKIDERFKADLPTFIEIDVPGNCRVREAHPFYSIGVAKDGYFLTWDSRELKMLGRGSYSASMVVILEESNYRAIYDQRLFLSGLLIGLSVGIPGWLERILELLHKKKYPPKGFNSDNHDGGVG